jgi:hypothetical protein
MRDRAMRASAPGQSALLMMDVAARLRSEGIPYVVIGAMAAAVHGSVRASLDADALVSVTISDAKSLQGGFSTEGLMTELRIGDADDPIPALLAISDGFGNRVDLLIGLRGLDPVAFARARNVTFFGESLSVVGREDFIAMKVFAGGPQDLADARQVMDIDRDALDVDLLQRLAARFGQETSSNLAKLLREDG